MKKQFTLMDGEERNRANPDTFQIPPEQDRLNIKPDTYVKLGFVMTKPVKGKPSAERMWVKVLSTTPIGGQYEGALANTPYFVKGIKFGGRVHFSAKHIIDIQPQEEE